MRNTTTRYHETTCLRDYHAFRRAVDDARWVDAHGFGTRALAYHDVGYGAMLSPGSVTELVETVDRLEADGRQLTALR